MKLRLRSLETKATHKIDVPNTCNLQQLQQILINELFPSSSSSSTTVQQTLLFSLNRKDELCGSSPGDSLQSLGVTSGDLVYFTQNPYAFSSQVPNLVPAQMGNSSQSVSIDDRDDSFVNTQMVESGKVGDFVVSSCGGGELGGAQVNEVSKLSNPNCDSSDLVNAQKRKLGKEVEFVCSSDNKVELGNAHVKGKMKLSEPNDVAGDLVDAQMIESGNLGENYGSSANSRDMMDNQMEGSSGMKEFDGNNVEVIEGTDGMEVDDDEAVERNVNARFSVPSFLKKVFVKEVGDATANGGNHKLLVIAVHAVLLESGFVGYDPVSGRKVDGFHLPDEWPSSAFGMSLHYTLPEVSSAEVVDTVILKFQTLGKFVNVYGNFPKKGFEAYRVCLDEHSFVPALRYVWKNADNGSLEKERDGSLKLYPNREIFEFWKTVKDGLSYPLLIELCEHVGLLPPPCFMRLPTELKLKIFEALPGVDIARVACVSSELRFLASNNDLWRLKYEEKYGKSADSRRDYQWKAKFETAWELDKKSKRASVPLQWREPPHLRPSFPGRRYPFIIGGDYDRFPAFGMPQHPGRRIFRRNDCNLGGFGV